MNTPYQRDASSDVLCTRRRDMLWRVLALSALGSIVSPKAAHAQGDVCTVAELQRMAPPGMTIGKGGITYLDHPVLSPVVGAARIPSDALGKGSPEFCYVTGTVVTHTATQKTAHFA